MTSPVIAVGRLLQPKHGEPRILHRIKIKPNGKAQTVVKQELRQPTA